MVDDDPLESMLFADSMPGMRKIDTKVAAEGRRCLNRLESLLAQPASKVELWKSGINRFGLRRIPPTEVSRAQELYLQVVARGGSGSSFVQEGLLQMIAGAKSTDSIPFWLEILDLARPRDSLAVKRRSLAVAAIALIAVRRNERVAFEALLKAARHFNPDVRAMAALYLGRVCPGCDDKLLGEVEACLMEMGTGDAVFGPRFQARFALRSIGKQVRLDCPGGLFLFKTVLEGEPDCYRTIALQSEQTLEDLHFAIQEAFEWDADHLYSFFMNNKPYDWRYTFVCPYEEDNPPFSDEAVIGELGLTKKHKFFYLFD